MSRIKNSTFIKVFWGVMGLYLLNISVDPADPNPDHIPEDLSFNDQESIVEIIVEKIMGFEHAFEEYDDHDSEDHNKKNNVKIDLTVQSTTGTNNCQLAIEEKRQRYSNFDARLTNGFYQLHTPPPKI